MTKTLAGPTSSVPERSKSAVLRSTAQHLGRKVQGPGTTGQSQRTQADAGAKPLRVSEGHPIAGKGIKE